LGETQTVVKTIAEFKAAFKMKATAGQAAPAPTGKVASAAAVEKALVTALKQLEACVGKLKKAGAPIDLFQPVLDDLQARYASARTETGLPDAELAAKYQAILDEAAARNTEFGQQLKAYLEFAAEKKKASEALAKLEKHQAKDKIEPEIEQARDDIAAAQGLADTGFFGDATDAMRTVVADCALAAVRGNLIKGDAPKTADFQALMKLPGKSGGKNRLDELIDGLPEEMQQKVFKTAIEARFGVKVGVFESMYKTVYETDEDGVSVGTSVERKEREYQKVDLKAPNKSLKRIYQMLTKVPEAHATKKLNPSLKRILHFTEDDGEAAYWDYNKTVYMNVSRGKGIGDDNVTDEISTGVTGTVDMFPDGRDESCLPKNTDVETTFFDWATLHEVGHSVDDLHGFMKGHLDQPDFGGWRQETLASVAQAAADNFGCDQAYIERKLNGEDVPDDELPPEFTADDAGAQLKNDVDAWCAAISVDTELWNDGGSAKENQLEGGRVYQEAYSGTWVSYNYGARRKGIHGYQFRSEAEWFAELYAAYYSDKLKDNHPAVPFLKQIEEEDTAKAAKKKKK
jgi:hypothetical protein